MKRRIAGMWPVSRLIRYRMDARTGAVALTFDDGPHPVFTEKVLAVLAAYQATATFFLLGPACEKHPELVQAIVDGGHAIGIHGMDHSSRKIVWQVKQCSHVLKELGVHTKAFRPPRGQLPVGAFCGLAMRGYTTYIWSHDRRDSLRAEGKWHDPAVPIESIAAGDIVLMHDDNAVCLQELPLILADLKQRSLGTLRL